MAVAIRRQLRAAVAPSVFLALVGYFGWNVTQGDRGLQAFAIRQEQLKIVQSELLQVNAERDTLERRVAGLRPQRLDPDTLDERARSMLGVADPADVVVLLGGPKRVF